ncbi:hypothetical protein GGX14DRAFT_561716 [Mycena pura]|uniref:Uncharacterized protein n=1 Tax=Mycena pura TaxID=153505 RepID=A0AAD6VMA6_9AGAR|nr:hypothetical protein GGX14DRAFT_561716 [Mycena pura]
MASLICNICDGAVEFRDHKELEEFLFGKLVAYGWRFDLALDTFLNVEVLRWVVYNHFACKQPKLNVKPRQNFKRTRGASRPKEDTSPAPIFHSLTSDSYLEIDCVPFSRLDTSLRQLRDTLKPGAAATLEFTTPAPNITFLSSEFNICAVPFLPRKYATPPPNTPHLSTPRPNRTATPLLASIHRVLEHLTVGPSALTLESLTNVSEMYADGLIAAVERLEDDRAARTAFVNQWGAAGLREELFMMAWEAALFRSGRHLIRWIVVVRK